MAACAPGKVVTVERLVWMALRGAVTDPLWAGTRDQKGRERRQIEVTRELTSPMPRQSRQEAVQR
jgi:hypothetical protein